MQTALRTVTSPTSLPALPTETAPLLASIRAFDTWLSETGYASYDPYDIWGTRFGLFSRRLYNGFGLASSNLTFCRMQAPKAKFLNSKQIHITKPRDSKDGLVAALAFESLSPGLVWIIWILSF